MEHFIDALHIEDDTIENTEYFECAFTNCLFSNAVLRSVKFVNCTFERCNFRNVSFKECSMLGAKFDNCMFMGLDWSDVRRHGARLALLSAMTNCVLKYNTFMKVHLAGVDLSGSTLHECFFQDCALAKADFRRCDLRDTVFQNCDLGRADFREAHNYIINLMGNRTTKAKFSQSDIIGLLKGFDIVIE